MFCTKISVQLTIQGYSLLNKCCDHIENTKNNVILSIVSLRGFLRSMDNSGQYIIIKAPPIVPKDAHIG